MITASYKLHLINFIDPVKSKETKSSHCKYIGQYHFS